MVRVHSWVMRSSVPSDKKLSHRVILGIEVGRKGGGGVLSNSYLSWPNWVWRLLAFPRA